MLVDTSIPTRPPPKWKVHNVLDALTSVDERIDELLNSRLNNGDQTHIARLQRELLAIADRFEISFIKRYKKFGKNEQKA